MTFQLKEISVKRMHIKKESKLPRFSLFDMARNRRKGGRDIVL